MGDFLQHTFVYIFWVYVYIFYFTQGLATTNQARALPLGTLLTLFSLTFTIFVPHHQLFHCIFFKKNHNFPFLQINNLLAHSLCKYTLCMKKMSKIIKLICTHPMYMSLTKFHYSLNLSELIIYYLGEYLFFFLYIYSIFFFFMRCQRFAINIVKVYPFWLRRHLTLILLCLLSIVHVHYLLYL